MPYQLDNLLEANSNSYVDVLADFCQGNREKIIASLEEFNQSTPGMIARHHYTNKVQKQVRV